MAKQQLNYTAAQINEKLANCGSNEFLVTFSFEEVEPYGLIADKTYSEVRAAILADKHVLGKMVFGTDAEAYGVLLRLTTFGEGNGMGERGGIVFTSYNKGSNPEEGKGFFCVEMKRDEDASKDVLSYFSNKYNP